MVKGLKLPFVAPVAGVSNYQSEVSVVRQGDRVTVMHEPANPYDTNACVVLVEGSKVGYLPKELAKRLIADGDDLWDGEIEEVLDGKTTGLRVRVSGERKETLEVSPAVAVPQKEAKVFSKSGRELGVYVRHSEDGVVIRTSSGLEVPYPADLVVLPG